LTSQLDRVDLTVEPVGLAQPAGDPLAGSARAPAEAYASWSPSLSPDGRHVAYVCDRSGAPRCWIQPIGSRLTFLMETGPHPVLSVAWSPVDGWLACLVSAGGGPRSELWLIRPDGSGLHQVAGFGADTASQPRWLPGQGLLAVTENAARALLIDPEAGARHTMAEGTLITLLDVSPDGRRVLLRSGPRGGRRLVVRDLATAADEPVAPGEQGYFTPDGEGVYARTELDGERPCLARVAGGRAEVLAARGDAELEGFALSADGRRAALVWNRYGGVSELTLLDLATGAECAVSPTPGTVIEVGDFSPGGGLAVTAEDPARPRGVWVLSGGAPRRVTTAAPLPSAVAPELHELVARDGLTITGWLYRPATGGPHPTVLSLHPGPEAQARPEYNPLVQALLAAGIAVFAPNVRGSAGFGRTFVNADNLAGRYGAVTDVADCARYLLGAAVAAPGRLGCLGRSYGGYLTLAALVSHPELFAAGVDVCGMANFETFYARTEPWIAAAAVTKYGDPVTDRDLLRDLSPITRIDRLTAPLLVVHGANDTNVPLGEAEQVMAALAGGPVPHRLLLFPDEGHDFLSRSNQEAYIAAAVDWLRLHLA
jgi:dipeptidyl aminopeptidase/acylaminoacyl peptidase